MQNQNFGSLASYSAISNRRIPIAESRTPALHYQSARHEPSGRSFNELEAERAEDTRDAD